MYSWFCSMLHLFRLDGFGMSNFTSRGYHIYLANAKREFRRRGSYEDENNDEIISPLNYVTVRKPMVRQFSDKLNSQVQDGFEKLAKFCSTFLVSQ